MRQPRHQHGEGGSARLYGSGAVLRSRERREGTVGSGQCDVLPWSDGTEHAGEGAAGESEEMTMDGLATDGALHDPISLSTVLLFFSICTTRTIIPIPAGGAIFIKTHCPVRRGIDGVVC